MLTKLEAINECLSAVGTAAVAASDSQHPAYLKARKKFDLVLRTVQSNGGRGYWYNRTYVTLTPAIDGTVTVPQYAIVCESTAFPQYVVRGSKLWDRSLRTFFIAHAANYRLIESLPYEDLPPSAREAVWTRAKHEYYLDEDGAEPKLSRYEDSAKMAFYELQADHLRHEDHNWFADTGLKYPQTRRLVVR